MPKLTKIVLLTALSYSPVFAADSEIKRPKVYTDIVESARQLHADTKRQVCPREAR